MKIIREKEFSNNQDYFDFLHKNNVKIIELTISNNKIHIKYDKI